MYDTYNTAQRSYRRTKVTPISVVMRMNNSPSLSSSEEVLPVLEYNAGAMCCSTPLQLTYHRPFTPTRRRLIHRTGTIISTKDHLSLAGEKSEREKERRKKSLLRHPITHSFPIPLPADKPSLTHTAHKANEQPSGSVILFANQITNQLTN